MGQAPTPVATLSDSQSPTSWPLHQKWATLLTASVVCFVVGINSTAILSATDEISAEFNVDLEHFDYSFFLVTAWNFGAAVIPLLLLPAMEDFGVKRIYVTIYVIFVIFVVVQAVARNFATLLVARFIAGSCGGALQNAIDGMSADVWGKDSKRMALSLTVFIFALLGGVTAGPVIGGGIIRYLQWRWIMYIQLIIYGVVFPLIVTCLHETRTIALSRQASSRSARIGAALNETVLRSSRMLCTEFVLSSFTLWSAFAFGTVFLLTQSIPLVYSTLYQWPAWKSGTVQVAILIGEMLGCLMCLMQDMIVYPRYSNQAKNDDNKVYADPEDEESINAEARLYTSIPGSLLGLTAGLFLYAWTSSPNNVCPWPLPTFGLLLIGTGIMVIVQAVTTYITEYYGSLANSAVSAIAFGENIFAAFLPLATRDMYLKLGFSWAGSLLGFIALVVSMAPIVLVIFGQKLRNRSNRIR